MRRLLLFAISCLIGTAGMAQTVIDGVNYKLDSAFKTAEVLPLNTKYSGTVLIPSMVFEKGINYQYSVTRIGIRAFKDCYNLMTVSIPNSVSTIDDYAFENSSLTSIVIPNSVSRIGRDAFSECHKLTAITLPSSITNIGKNAFGKCENLLQVTVERQEPAKIDSTSFPDRANQVLYVPQGCKSAYENAKYWCEFKEIKE